ncbi:uncharacterized protein [Panulirus ornatus]|uniref:uncharacterized protein n=1 Tax=Panulirus ornatus TaxID=150431 RepID=UPI003A87DD33
MIRPDKWCSLLQDRVCRQPYLGGVVATWLYLQRGMFGQSVPALPRALWQRMFLAFWYLYCLLVTIYYTSNLTAIFTNPANPQLILTLQQLADSDYRIRDWIGSSRSWKTSGYELHPMWLAMAEYGIPISTFLSELNSDVKLYEKLDFFPVQDDAVAAMLVGSHALLDTVMYGQVVLRSRHQAAKWYMVREQLLPSYTSWYFPKHTPWKDKFDQGIQRLVEAGLCQHWLKGVEDSNSEPPRGVKGFANTITLIKSVTRRSVFIAVLYLELRCCTLLQMEVESLLGWDWKQRQQEQRTNMVFTLQHLQGVFYILILAWAASVAVFLLELLRHRCSHRQEPVTAAAAEAPLLSPPRTRHCCSC